MSSIAPFADDTATLSIGEFHVENGTHAVSLYGSLDITRDRAGLNHARQLADLLAQIVVSLEGEPALPAIAAPAKETGDKVPNPFA
ncbi:hypothetical protein [Polymorphobacter megasporae]|uniref:hypothetical protein n=1 Tax=Glacieibacterium megasporae TaxID=2835787 RepID=UPI001C1E597C|nr:hypothetical protein [Polymorphobacter megasporae]UAJ08881.1 hypothetical protein KTC28_10875 [Polymorphobacter megasporae]